MTERTTHPHRRAACRAHAPASHAQLNALNLVREAIYIIDITEPPRFYWANEAALALWQSDSLSAWCQLDVQASIPSAVLVRLAQHHADFIAHDAHFTEPWTLYLNGRPVVLNTHVRGYPLPDGRLAAFCQAAPIEMPTPGALRSVDALLHTDVMISLFRLDGTPLYRNPTARASAHLFNEPLLARFAEPDACRRLLNEVAQRGEARSILPMHTVAGPRWHDITARLQRDAATGDVSVLVSEIDVTRQKEDEARAVFLSAHDVLTGLCNRDALRRRFDELMAQGHRSSGLQAALILVDLDRFKDVNDTMGHSAGDELLVQVAARLRQAVRSDDLVARYGGDEFLILLHGPNLQSVVRCIDHRIRQAIAPPVLVDDVPVYVSVTIGVSRCPDDGHDFDTLLCRADMAMHAAKTGGPNALAFYEPHMGSELSARTTLEADLRRALAAQEFVLYYQPRVDLPSQRIVGAEALLRWEHPTRGLVPPLEFIPVCEAIGLIHELGRQVFNMAAHQQAQWRQRGLHLTLSVNLSSREFDAPDLLASLEHSIADAGCPPEALQLEITESMLMRADDQPLRTLCALRSLGLSIALDDFGTGYSNLAYLQRFPFDVLKIDRTFVQAHPQDRPLAEAIALMGRTLRLAVVAEGVETEEQLAWLSRLGVNEYQGFLFSRPLPADAFQALLAHHGHNIA